MECRKGRKEIQIQQLPAAQRPSQIWAVPEFPTDALPIERNARNPLRE
jgi:hypothetical protein